MPWRAQLQLDYHVESNRTVARHSHSGPLRILQSLYPEGDAVCHNVLVHPPGGLVGGDTLELSIHAHADSHGLVTTPGATRFYRSDGDPARQQTHLTLDAGARLEWLPLEAICYSGCLAENHLTIHLAPGSQCMGWDITALGLPHANEPFTQGNFSQHLEVPGMWLERGTIDANDKRLLDGPTGLAGHRCFATFFLLAGSPIDKTLRQTLLENARNVIGGSPLAATCGVTSPHDRVVVVRVLAPWVEPAMSLMRGIRTQWRTLLWHKSPVNPRIWSM